MILAGFPVQKATYNRIKDALSVPVFDDVPEDQPFPYVEIGGPIASSSNAKKCFIDEVMLPLHIWDSSGAMGDNATIDQVGNEILKAMTVGDDKIFIPLTLPDHRVIMQNLPSGMEYIKNPDTSIRHGVLNFEFLVNEK